MSASPIARQAHSHVQAIPSKRVLITDPSQMPDIYSSTPGGTIFSTTPGGTKIVYERAFLMNLRNSPLARTPPTNVPSGLMRGAPNVPIYKTKPAQNFNHRHSPPKNNHHPSDQDQFQLDL